jgi:hypothetical protein
MKLVVLAAFACLTVGCAEGPYHYQFEAALRSPGGDPIIGKRVAVSLWGSVPNRSHARESLAGRQNVVSDSAGVIRGVVTGWFSWPIATPGHPQVCKADKMWVYVEQDSAPSPQWTEVIVPVRTENMERTGEYGPCSGNITGIVVVVPQAESK